jgi:hypothetical protein
VTGTADTFRIEALTSTGRRILKYLAGKANLFDFCKTVDFGPERIGGVIRRPEGSLDEQARLKSTNQMDVIRAVAFAFELASKPFRITLACWAIGLHQLKTLASRQDILGNPITKWHG